MILVTRQEYWTIIWLVYTIAWFHITARMFLMPHEVADDSNS